MLSVYTRHSQKCPHRDDISWRRCRCPKWIQGTPSEEQKFVRTSAQTRTWERAEAKARHLEEAARPGARKPAPAVSIAEAVAAYRADETGRCLAKSTTNRSKTLFEVHLLAWAKDVGLTMLKELTTTNLIKFRATWGNGPNTTRRKHERLIGFFEFCISNDWLEKNPAAKMKKVEEKRVPTDYFTREEFHLIVDATYAYGDWRGGRDVHYHPERVRALILLMRWSGLAIRDAVALERDRLGADGKLFLYRAKTGVPVRVPLPTEVAQLLCSLPATNPNFFFWSGNGDPETAKKGSCFVSAAFKHVRRFKAARGYFRAGKMRVYATLLKTIESVESALLGLGGYADRSRIGLKITRLDMTKEADDPRTACFYFLGRVGGLDETALGGEPHHQLKLIHAGLRICAMPVPSTPPSDPHLPVQRTLHTQPMFQNRSERRTCC